MKRRTKIHILKVIDNAIKRYGGADKYNINTFNRLKSIIDKLDNEIVEKSNICLQCMCTGDGNYIGTCALNLKRYGILILSERRWDKITVTGGIIKETMNLTDLDRVTETIKTAINDQEI